MTVTDVIMRESKKRTMNQPWKESVVPIITEYGTVPVGSQYKVFETKNFGWLVFGPNTRTIDGNILLRRIYKY